ncbi:MAG: carboxynorspermidine decarboxylase [Chloroherpetonaceae bacterium]|nr:carboxynorspermidine decarboxylase [Chloroherpetonaceae bacterium]MCS7210765.1 carboxynorspermidine decarboxylase [Chloroherpetonaceae bacterium]MDW8019509.1 carboxynorspermidine decarboxylase [Chloroherpetonaceae bacterium]MDW8466435.1 carboxynorspermidine decarboxylase [Chloroherpetonaceae bacterium]
MAIDFSCVPNPCYVIEEARLRQNLETISYVAKSAGVEIILALKGFALWKTFPIVRQYVRTATASSLNEARLCVETFGEKAHIYCVAIDDRDIDALLDCASHITFNSFSQFERFKHKARAKGVSIGLRVNPEHREVQTDLYNPCSPYSRLGLTAEHFQNGLPSEIEGLHLHGLCENDSFASERMLNAFEEKFGKLFSQLRWVNLGGGHLITRKGYDTAHFISVLKAFKARYPHLQVILEPGGAFAWQTGYLVSKVLDIVENRGVKTAIVNVSFTDHMPDCLEMPYKPSILGAIPEYRKGLCNYRIGGLSCLAGDFMTEYAFEKPLQVGDLIVFEDMIHYTIVKTTMFNGISHPALGMWTADNQFTLFRSFDYEDYKNRMS